MMNEMNEENYQPGTELYGDEPSFYRPWQENTEGAAERFRPHVALTALGQLMYPTAENLRARDLSMGPHPLDNHDEIQAMRETFYVSKKEAQPPQAKMVMSDELFASLVLAMEQGSVSDKAPGPVNQGPVVHPRHHDTVHAVHHSHALRDHLPAREMHRPLAQAKACA